MIEQSKYCSDVMKKCFNKKLVMTKKNNKDFKNFTKYWTCANAYVKGNIKVRDHYHITGRYRRSADKDCNIKVKLSQKIPVVFHNLKNFDSYIIMQKLDKFNFKQIQTQWIGKIYEL